MGVHLPKIVMHTVQYVKHLGVKVIFEVLNPKYIHKTTFKCILYLICHSISPFKISFHSAKNADQTKARDTYGHQFTSQCKV